MSKRHTAMTKNGISFLFALLVIKEQTPSMLMQHWCLFQAIYNYLLLLTSCYDTIKSLSSDWRFGITAVAFFLEYII